MQTDRLGRASVDELPDAVRPNGWKGAMIVAPTPVPCGNEERLRLMSSRRTADRSSTSPGVHSHRPPSSG